MKNNLLVYYGVIANEAEIMSFMSQCGEKDLKAFLLKQNLKYRKTPSYNQTKKIIIGDEIICNSDTTIIRLLVVDNKPKFEDKNMIKELSISEQQIRTNLFQVGIHDIPGYYILSNYEI